MSKIDTIIDACRLIVESRESATKRARDWQRAASLARKLGRKPKMSAYREAGIDPPPIGPRAYDLSTPSDIIAESLPKAIEEIEKLRSDLEKAKSEKFRINQEEGELKPELAMARRSTADKGSKPASLADLRRALLQAIELCGVESKPGVLGGRIVICGTRIPVHQVLELLADELEEDGGFPGRYEDLTQQYDLSKEEILLALRFATRVAAL